MDINQIKEKAIQLVNQMTTLEMASLCVGRDFWNLNGIARLGIPSVNMSDGPHGLRKQRGEGDHLGLNAAYPAICYPAACLTACSWDTDLIYELGQALGEECLSEDVGILLGPGINIKRNPLCGRNFEYFSEDPLLSGKLGAAFIDGVQSKGVGTSLKHFAGNNQETRRMTTDSIIDERALREIYLKPFEIAVKEAQPWTVMSAYNKLNGSFCSENERLLTDILRDEWEFDGAVVTDWGAMSDQLDSYLSGLDIEMPGLGTARHDKALAQAVNSGNLSHEDLKAIATRIVELILKVSERHNLKTNDDSDVSCDDDAICDAGAIPASSLAALRMDSTTIPRYSIASHLNLASKIATESAVLLKNGGLLPLSDKSKIAIIGAFAKAPRYQGTGSSKINALSLDNPYDAFIDAGFDVDYAPGYDLKDDYPRAKLIDEAVDIARGKDVAVLFVGLPDSYEAEGLDREHMNMPHAHIELINKIAKVNANIVVVLQCGSPVDMSWENGANSILLTYLAGCRNGRATVDLLCGRANPSGKLAETWPSREEDAPNADAYPELSKAVRYKESIYVGYRYYDSVGMNVRYPFGYGLSYTTFAYRNLTYQPAAGACGRVSFDITNTGDVFGKEIVQLYISQLNPKIFRPSHELKAYQKISLEPGETMQVTFELNYSDFAYYDVLEKRFAVESGKYTLSIGSSSREQKMSTIVTIEGDIESRDYRESLPSYYISHAHRRKLAKGFSRIGGALKLQLLTKNKQTGNLDAVRYKYLKKLRPPKNKNAKQHLLFSRRLQKFLRARSKLFSRAHVTSDSVSLVIKRFISRPLNSGLHSGLKLVSKSKRNITRLRDTIAQTKIGKRYIKSKFSSEEFTLLYGLNGSNIPAEPPKRPYTQNSTLNDFGHLFLGRILLRIIDSNVHRISGEDKEDQKYIRKMMMDFPIRQLSMSGAKQNLIEGLVYLLNGRIYKAIRRLMNRL
ncbi:MAG: glycoside hydrolase family 3 C-terminal domain-containing protein [Clostridiales Family XIII bacterium]|jgi:beta-glucosidase|nr:glycoside hydrolase family 3 C-terminal domain-containing protein [Clostridiales Family XIII bacterium]